VIARTSSFAFRGKEDDVRRIAAALDVTHVLAGSVRRAGGRIRITAQLIAATDGSHLWSERYDRELSDVFAVQDEIAGEIHRALQGRLLPSASTLCAEARKAYEVGSWCPDARATLAALLLKNGAEEEARRLHESIGAGQSYGDCRSQSLFYMLCGEVDIVADWAEKAITERDCSMMHYLRFVVAKELRASPRWPRIAKLLNLPAGL
jgi:hypothetical protein